MAHIHIDYYREIFRDIALAEDVLVVDGDQPPTRLVGDKMFVILKGLAYRIVRPVQVTFDGDRQVFLYQVVRVDIPIHPIDQD